MAWRSTLDGVEPPRRRADSIDGVGRPKFDFRAAPDALRPSEASRFVEGRTSLLEHLGPLFLLGEAHGHRISLFFIGVVDGCDGDLQHY